ncbi:MAG: ornithine aminomutase subunit alpha [Candidatus Delongbacteria bacterium]|nr:ornithine aminomutase subunit alpha [Candidatus Delongbacteria bacterium]
MPRIQPRSDDFDQRSHHLRSLSDDQLHARFWELADRIVTPLIELAVDHTSPSIERSVLLRMGFDSIISQTIVKQIEEKHLLGHGAGNLVLKLAQKERIPYLEAGIRLAEGYPIETLVD